MDIEDQFELEHLFLTERKCRICGQTKDLIDGFYLTRKSRGDIPSSYSYECKECTKKRIISNRKQKPSNSDWQYPDW
jgi:DNA-directed RNA polymerase subunit M/transcription elongation factor TFIIS